jgi:hypothetical protein
MIRKIIGLFLLTLFVSCKQTLDSSVCLKNESTLKLNIINSDTVLIGNSVDLEINSAKMIELRNWIDNNSTKWENSIISYVQPLISVIENDFRMLIFKSFVVIGFKDKNDKSRQITKQTDYNEFDFLTLAN